MAGDVKKEFQEFWIQTAARVRAYMFCACRNWEDADDLAQDCYLRALRGWSQFNGSSSRQAWLFGIARRTRVDWYRKRKRERPPAHSENLDEFGWVAPGEPDADNVEAVWESVKVLKAEHGQVVHLRFAVGLSYAEIAQALEVPIGTVRSRLHRALKEIRQKIRELENGS